MTTILYTALAAITKLLREVVNKDAESCLLGHIIYAILIRGIKSRRLWWEMITQTENAAIHLLVTYRFALAFGDNEIKTEFV